MLDDIFRDLQEDWARDFVVENAPLDDVRLMTMPNVERRRKPHFMKYQLEDDCPVILVQGTPMCVVEKEDLLAGLNIIQVQGIGNYEKYSHTSLSVRRYLFHKRRQTGFLLAHEKDTIEVCWFARGVNSVFVHAVFERRGFLTVMNAKGKRDGEEGGYGGDSCGFLDMGLLAESLVSFNIHVAVTMEGTTEQDVREPNDCIPYYNGRYKTRATGSTILQDVKGYLQASRGLPSYAMERLRLNAVQKRMSFVAARPTNDLTVVFDFSGVCSAVGMNPDNVDNGNGTQGAPEEVTDVSYDEKANHAHQDYWL